MRIFKSNISAALVLIGLLTITGFLIYEFFGAQKPLPGPYPSLWNINPPLNQQTNTNEQQLKLKINSSEQLVSKKNTVSRNNIKERVKNQTFPKRVLLNVPFTSQAPFAKWQDPIYQNACEEASILMAARWIENKTLSKEEAKKEIAEIANFELEKYGHFHDSSAKDTAKIIRDYFGYQKVKVVFSIGTKEIRSELAKGNLIVVPADGRKLKNPFYTPPGTERHMIVIRGYDEETKEFITNDPGTKRGGEFRYSYEVLEKAIQDYPSGYHEPILERNTAMIVISAKES